MNKVLIFIVSLILGATFFQSCEVINPDESIPAYVSISTPKVVSGTDTFDYSGIKDAWVFQGNGVQGIYEFPATFPTLNLNDKNFTVFPGYYETGLSSFRKIHPFIKAVEFEATLSAKDTFHIQPIFEYWPDTVLTEAWREDFEGVQIGIENYQTYGSDQAYLLKSTENSYQGTTCGVIEFDATHRYIQLQNIFEFTIPSGKDVLLEFSFRGNAGFDLGFVGTYSGTSVLSEIVSVNVRDYWNTIYINLTNLSLGADSYKVWMRSEQDGSTKKLFVDHLRVLYFKES